MTQAPDLNDLIYFAEVVERGGFAAAGRALGIPKSRLSRRISALEAQLGVRLLQRTTRQLSLTDAGETYLRHCQAVREAAQAAADAVAQVQTEPRGTVRVSCPVTLAQTVLAGLMPEFLALYPLVRIEMQISNRVVNVVEEGVDVALRVRSTLDDSASMVVKRLDDSVQILVASPVLVARHGMPDSVAALARFESLAMSATDGRAVLHLVAPDGRAHTLQHSPRYVADDLLTLKFAALAGTGMCWLPDYLCAGEVQSGQLVQLLPGWTAPRGIVHAVFASRRGLTPAVRRFLDFLGERLPGHAKPRHACDSGAGAGNRSL